MLFSGFELPDLAVRLAELATIISLAIVANWVFAIGLRRLTRRAVGRAEAGSGTWRKRLPRIPETNQLIDRRLQRADATAKMLARLTTLMIMAIAALSISQVLEFDPLVFISSAGFVGAGIAIGGQSVIKDWLSGLLVLLEDRYAEGDRVVMTVAGQQVTGEVLGINSTSVRLWLDDNATWHAGHGVIESVRNESQRPMGFEGRPSAPMEQ